MWCTCVVGAAWLAWCATSGAQTFYKWTDEHGVVHFSDSAPAQAKGVEERNLPPPPAGGQPEAAQDTGEAAATPGTPGATGPARIILVSRKAPRTGPSTMHIIGEVKNVGGADARGVAVTISAVDATQGDPCLNEQAAVAPSTLHPGESGNFDVNVDSPCLYGQPRVDVSPVWE